MCPYSVLQSFNGRPINDLELSDMRLLDDGKRQKKILKFEHRTDLPLRAGILVDVSGSMAGDYPFLQLATNLFAERILHSNSDQAFMMRFASMQKMVQDWTNSADALRAANDSHWSSLGLQDRDL